MSNPGRPMGEQGQALKHNREFSDEKLPLLGKLRAGSPAHARSSDYVTLLGIKLNSSVSIQCLVTLLSSYWMSGNSQQAKAIIRGC